MGSGQHIKAGPRAHVFHLDTAEHLYYRCTMDMQMQVRVSALASGSSGNAFLVEAGDVKLLIDAGLSGSTLEQYLRLRGTAASELAAIFVSHEHIDHLRGAGMLARRYKLPVIATEGTFRAGAWQFGSLPERIVQHTGGEIQVGSVTVRSFAVSHDAADTAGYWIEAGGLHVAICTDLGCETGAIRDALAAADLLVLEANHDLQKLWKGPYPWPLKKRVASDKGHLPNEETARLVSELAQDGHPRTVWLAHLSATNNTPALAYDTVAEPLDRDGCAHISIAVLARDKPSHVWEHVAAVDVAAPAALVP
jgi:phosphoribosyl 1,2-cyclic phosphodiesterase